MWSFFHVIMDNDLEMIEMPSFVIHSICCRELEKKMTISKKEKDMFFLGNLIPDTKQSDHKNATHESISKEKIVTHFKTNPKPILQYPDLDLFLSEYGELVKTNSLVFGYFFHLYADYYYFKYYLPDKLSFLDSNYKETDSRDYSFVKSKKNGKIFTIDDFWDRKKNIGIYYEYSRMNKYLISKYNFTYDVNCYLPYVESKLEVPITEVVTDRLRDLLLDVDYFYKERIVDTEFQIFDTDSVDTLITEILDTFMERYSDIYYNYCR